MPGNESGRSAIVRCPDGDFDRGRIYVPADTMEKFGYGESRFAARRADEAFRQMLRHEVDRAETYLTEGRPLVKMMPRPLRTMSVSVGRW